MAIYYLDKYLFWNTPHLSNAPILSHKRGLYVRRWRCHSQRKKLRVQHWNGDSMISVPIRSNPGDNTVPDASGNWGCEAYTSRGECFQFQWPEAWAAIHKRIAPHCCVLRTEGPQLEGKNDQVCVQQRCGGVHYQLAQNEE